MPPRTYAGAELVGVMGEVFPDAHINEGEPENRPPNTKPNATRAQELVQQVPLAASLVEKPIIE